ncbi:hypothetical protein GCM10027598_00580 [Amycolatopsis oliviviridis]|uniref:Immunity protein Imm1 n=1 Tax=Amycolatopsis oliviviridis TaxID=1471590 RepID=A0ABQ3LWB3_9PSEU|nr:Imm1 family immunity protein [Amycolatopsis oliviviridis]GHH22919.1 hypothetical protein GCM10017790_45290 [Amycolatopsis oliviviridis]
MTLEACYHGHTDQPVIVTGEAELDAVLDSVAALEGPQVVQLFVDGDIMKPDLTVGLHGDRGTLRYADEDQEYYSKSGAFPLPEHGEVIYYLGRAEFEYPDDAEIPAADARNAAQEFLSTGGARPACVEWAAEA